MDFYNVLLRIKPSQKERKQVIKLAQQIMKKIKILGAKAVIGGSFAKDTWLKDTRDIDIYVVFNYRRYHDSSEPLSDILYRKLRMRFSVARLHGSRDYFHVRSSCYTFEIVPILSIRSHAQAQNITDFSPFHVRYVRRHKRLVDEIRLAKAFAKAQNVYGAESYIRGFSGYVLELLVIHYGSFLKLVKAAATWKPKVVIGSKRKAEKMSWAKRVSPLILVDPVQPDRNAAAALSEERFWGFVQTCQQFIKQPSEEFFVKQPLDIGALKKRGKVICVTAVPLRKKEDVAGAKALKAFELMKRTLTQHEFLVLDFYFVFGKPSKFYFVVDRKQLHDYTVVVGPPVTMKAHVSAFRKKYPNAEVEGGRAVAHVKRRFSRVEDLFRSVVRRPELLRLVQSVRYEVLE